MLPWHRWRLRATLWLALAAFVFIGVSTVAGLVPAMAYGVFFVLVFAWVGMHHPPGTAFRLVPFAVVAYVAPVLAVDTGLDLDPRAVLVAMSISVHGRQRPSPEVNAPPSESTGELGAVPPAGRWREPRRRCGTSTPARSWPRWRPGC